MSILNKAKSHAMGGLRKVKLTVASLMVCSIVATTPAHAGIPVIDIASIIQSILSVLNEISSIENQISQIEHQVEHYKSIIGNRNLGQILNDPNLQNYLPESVVQDYNNVDQGYSGLSSEGKSLRDAGMIYNCVNLQGTQQTQCQADLARPYQQKAQLQDALAKSQGRLQQIQGLMDQINQTDDPKAQSELNGRIQAEQAMIANENSKTEMMLGVYQAEQKAQEGRNEERRLERASRTGSVTSDVQL